MIVHVRFDLTCPNQLALFQEVKARMHSQDLPEQTAQAVRMSTKLGSDLDTVPDRTPKEVREHIADAMLVDKTATEKYAMKICEEYNVNAIGDLNGDQCSIVIHELEKIIALGEQLPT